MKGKENCIAAAQKMEIMQKKYSAQKKEAEVISSPEGG
jgi:hypothetical protein